jgi:hypothetical protein
LTITIHPPAGLNVLEQDSQPQLAGDSTSAAIIWLHPQQNHHTGVFGLHVQVLANEGLPVSGRGPGQGKSCATICSHVSGFRADPAEQRLLEADVRSIRQVPDLLHQRRAQSLYRGQKGHAISGQRIPGNVCQLLDPLDVPPQEVSSLGSVLIAHFVGATRYLN